MAAQPHPPTSLAPVSQRSARRTRRPRIYPHGAGRKTLDQVIQIAFTAAGLCMALGVSGDVLKTFSPEFVEGMAGGANRSLGSGDIGENATARTSEVGRRRMRAAHSIDPVREGHQSADALADEMPGRRERSRPDRHRRRSARKQHGRPGAFRIRRRSSQPSFDWEVATQAGHSCAIGTTPICSRSANCCSAIQK